MLVIGGGILAIAVIYFLVHAVAYDTCTASYDRSPQSIVRTYVNSIAAGSVKGAMDCWNKNDYYSLETGCSEICLARLWGVPMKLTAADFAPITATASKRDEILVQITMACSDGTTQETGQITLDTANANLPWAHWKIVQSSVGGNIASPWCR